MEKTTAWPERIIVTDSQRVEHPVKWRKSATMTNRWRLINGEELYDIQTDPEQKHNIVDLHSDVVQNLRAHYEQWWTQVSDRFDEDVPIPIATEHEPITVLTCHDWHNQNSDCAWHQGMIRKGMVCNGRWTIDVPVEGDYTFELRRWPREENRPICAAIPGKLTLYNGGNALDVTTAHICIDNQKVQKTISETDCGVAFAFHLLPGEKHLETRLSGTETELGAYYVYVQKTE